MVFVPAISIAADQSTFESFYKGSAVIYWAFGALLAIAGGAFIFFTGGTASPVVVGMGTWVGSMMGYSGIAATNAGLALLGGGSVVSGGLGILGGTALLTAALSFGSGAVIDYSIETAIAEYNYAKFAERSKQMTSLPLPNNSSGPASYSAAYKILKKANDKESIFTEANQHVIKEAAYKLQAVKDAKLTNSEIARSQTLLALLQFSQNQYSKSKKTANAAYEIDRSINEKGTLAAFIYSTSALYDKKIDFTASLNKFKLAISAEPKNPLTSLLFAIYLDRLMYRLDDGSLKPKHLNQVYEISKSLMYDETKAVVQLGLLNRYFIRLFSEDQRIRALTGTENRILRDSHGTLTDAQDTLKRYKSLISSFRAAASSQKNILDARLNSNTSKIDFISGSGVKEWERKWSEELSSRLITLSKYAAAVKDLEIRISQLQEYQEQLSPIQAESTYKAQKELDQSKHEEAVPSVIQ